MQAKSFIGTMNHFIIKAKVIDWEEKKWIQNQTDYTCEPFEPFGPLDIMYVQWEMRIVKTCSTQ